MNKIVITAAAVSAGALGLIGGQHAGVPALNSAHRDIALTATDATDNDAANTMWVPNFGTDQPGHELTSGLSFAPLFQTVDQDQSYDLYPDSAQNAHYPTQDLLGIVNGESQYTTFMGGMSNWNFVVDSIGEAGTGKYGDFTNSNVPAGFITPTKGSEYDVFNFGNGYENVYSDIEGGKADPSGAGFLGDTVHDTLITPFGNVDLDWLFGDFDPLLNSGGPEADWTSGFDLGAFDNIPA